MTTTTQTIDALRDAIQETAVRADAACQAHRAATACLTALAAAPDNLQGIDLTYTEGDTFYEGGRHVTEDDYAEPTLVDPTDPKDGDTLARYDDGYEEGQENPLDALWDEASHDLLALWEWAGGGFEEGQNGSVVLERPALEAIVAETEAMIRRVAAPLVPAVEDLDFDLSPYVTERDPAPQKPEGLSLAISFDDGVEVYGWRQGEDGSQVPLGGFHAGEEWGVPDDVSGERTEEETAFLEWAAQTADAVVYGWTVEAFGGDAVSRLAARLTEVGGGE